MTDKKLKARCPYCRDYFSIEDNEFNQHLSDEHEEEIEEEDDEDE